MQTFSTRCPTRIDLAGGTIDLWPIWAIVDNCTTVNASIDIYTQCELQPLETSHIEIHSPDIKKMWSFGSIDELYSAKEDALSFFKAHIRHWNPKQGFRLTAQSQSPVGGGLGGSSSLSVAIYKTFQQWLRPNLSDIHKMVTECSHIEAKVLATPTGLQDYYGAASEGLNLMAFSTHGVALNTITSHQRAFNDSIIVVYTGKSHHSGINNWGVLKKFIDKDNQTIRALQTIRDVSLMVTEACAKGKWSDLPELFTQDFKAREDLSVEFMSAEIRELKKITDAQGAHGFKICGAGGGGCVAVWCRPQDKSEIAAAIGRSGYQVLQARFL